LNAQLVDRAVEVQGKVIWLDEYKVHLLTREKLDEDRPHTLRIDLGGRGDSVVVQVQVQAIQDGHDTMYKWGWLHIGPYRLLAGGSQEALERRLSEVNPQVSVTGSMSSSPRTSRGTASPFSATHDSGPSSADTSGMARRSGRARVMRAMARRRGPRPVELEPPWTPDGPDSTSSQDRREDFVRLEPEKSRRKAVPESRIVRPVYSAGPPPGLFASFPTRETLAPALVFDDNGVCTVLATVPEVEVGDVLELILQLPDRSTVQLISMVLRKGKHRVYVQSHFVEPQVIALLRSMT